DYALPDTWQIARDVPGFPGCTSSWDTRISQAFGPTPAVGAEDMVLFFRAALLGRGEDINAPLVRYRRHRTNTSRWAHEEDRSCANYLNLSNRIARDRLNLCRAFVHDLERFIELRPEQAERARRAIGEVREQIAFYEMRRRVTSGEKLRPRELAGLLRL